MTAIDGTTKWVNRGRDFYSSPDGRFDLMKVMPKAGGAYWVCIDHDLGRVFRATFGACLDWARRAEGGA